MISVLIPIYIAREENIAMTRKCIDFAKYYCDVDDVEWIIVETCSTYFINDADIYINEFERTTPTQSINNGFSKCSGDYIVLLSNDVYVGEKWLSSMLDCFNIDDCGLSTLGTKQFSNVKEDKIVEFIYFPIAMIPKKYAKYDERFVSAFNDTDIVMKVYLDGKKMYQNMNSICEHLSRATQGGEFGENKKYVEDRIRFREKYKEFENTDIYKYLA